MRAAMGVIGTSRTPDLAGLAEPGRPEPGLLHARASVWFSSPFSQAQQSLVFGSSESRLSYSQVGTVRMRSCAARARFDGNETSPRFFSAWLREESCMRWDRPKVQSRKPNAINLHETGQAEAQPGYQSCPMNPTAETHWFRT